MDIEALPRYLPRYLGKDKKTLEVFCPRFCLGRDACLDLATLFLSFPMDERNLISWAAHYLLSTQTDVSREGVEIKFRGYKFS